MNARTETAVIQTALQHAASDHQLSNAHLDALEEETIFILREVAAAFERPALLFSGGKDSLVMLKCAEKAFGVGRIPYPLLMIDTGHNFPEVTDFRDFRAKELGAELIVRSVEDSMKRGTVRLAHPGESRNVHQSVTLLEAIEEQVTLLRLMSEMVSDDKGLSASIGRENEPFGLIEASVLASRYDGATGGARVGLLGPMRMDYSSNLAAVRAVAHYLTRMLEDDDSAR